MRKSLLVILEIIKKEFYQVRQDRRMLMDERLQPALVIPTAARSGGNRHPDDAAKAAHLPGIASGETIRFFSWLRIGPDIIFAGGAVLLLVFLVRAVVLSLRRKETGLPPDGAAPSKEESHE